MLDSAESPKRTYRIDEPSGRSIGKVQRSFEEVPRNGEFNAQQTLPSDRSAKKQQYEPIAVIVDSGRKSDQPVGKGYIFGDVTPPTKNNKKDEERERRKFEKEEKHRKEQLEKERKRFEKELKTNPDLHGIVVLEGTPKHSQSPAHSPRNGNQYASSSSPMSSPASDDDRRASSRNSGGKRQTTSPRSYVTNLPYSTSTPYKQVAPTSLSMDESGLNERFVQDDSPRSRAMQQPPRATSSPRVNTFVFTFFFLYGANFLIDFSTISHKNRSFRRSFNRKNCRKNYPIKFSLRLRRMETFIKRRKFDWSTKIFGVFHVRLSFFLASRAN